MTSPLTGLLGEGTGNNYAYLVSDDKTKEAVIIDPANPPEYVQKETISTLGFGNNTIGSYPS